MQYNISGLPEDLPPGQYNTKVLNSRWVKCLNGSVDWLIELEFEGPADPNGHPHQCLFPLTKEDVQKLP